MSEILDRAGIPFVLIGGFAVNYYQFSRATGDVDFMMTEENFDRAWPLLKRAGCQLMVRTPLFATFKGNVPPYFLVDILFVEENTMKGVLEKGKEAEVAGRKLHVPSLEHLLALKLHALKNNLDHRESKDLRDIIEMARENKLDAKSTSFQKLCLEYGTPEIYEKIRRAFP